MGQVYIVGKVSSRPIRPFNIASFLTRALNHPFLTRVVTYTIKDDLSGKTLVSKQETPPAAPLGYTNMLLGAQAGAKPIMLVPLADAPEGGVCKP